MIAIVIYVGVGFMVVSFLTSMSAMIVGWSTLNKKKLVKLTN
jgi:hypothetical protein